MARTAKKKETPVVVVTKAEKKDATKNLIREVLAVKPLKHNELIDEVAKLYVERFGGEETDNMNDVKGRVGSVIDIMKKESDVMYDGGMYALKARIVEEPVQAGTPKTEKTEKKTTRKSTKKTAVAEEKKEEGVAEKPTKKATRKSTKAKKEEPVKVEEPVKEEEPLILPPPTPLQPIAPVDPVTPDVAPEPLPEEKPKKRTSKKKAIKEEVKKEEPKEETLTAPMQEETKEEKPQEQKQEITVKSKEEIKTETAKDVPVAVLEEEKPQETENKNALQVKEKAEVAPKSVVMDMSFLFGNVKSAKPEKKAEEKETPVIEKKAEPLPEKEEKTETKAEVKEEKKVENKEPQKVSTQQQPPRKQKEEPREQPKEQAKKPVEKTTQTVKTESVKQVQVRNLNVKTVRKPAPRVLTADERLRESFLKRIRSLGGDYFEYYSVYLLERYSMKNGRRLEGLKISGGDHDGGIDGEIELTDKFGFKETIYIQSKNWDPDKGDEKLWVVGETLLQQFIGACACRQAKDGKQHCRGIFVTTSRFTPDAKRVLEAMSDKIVGYDGEDLYEAAKECSFGLIRKNNEWVLDEQLLSGEKAFFNML